LRSELKKIHAIGVEKIFGGGVEKKSGKKCVKM
jgi:hypothetical protein